jgi:micrococcal nuclease
MLKILKKYFINKNKNMSSSEIKFEDTLPFIPPIHSGKVIKVYDGDTITIASKLPYAESPLYRFSVRLNGIDSPEIKTKSEEEKKLAQKAKEKMSELVLGKNIILKNVQVEKYGRILADVYINNIHVNEYMIEQGLAVRYNGGTKGTFEENFL